MPGKNKQSQNIQYIVGIDEAGRGPLAGPVSIGLVAIPKSCDSVILGLFFPDGKIRDSKRLSEQQRERIFELLQGPTLGIQKVGPSRIQFTHVFVSHKIIDQKGISFAIKSGVERVLKKAKLNPVRTQVLLDGSLKAPEIYKNQKTIIKGDEKELAIALASIVAKVMRDRYVIKLAKKYPQYNLDKHKGYGTKEHYEALVKNGICEIHRKSYLKKFKQKTIDKIDN